MARCTVTFRPANVTVEVDTEKPVEGVGLAGSLLNIASANRVEIDHPCEGVGTCGLCYVEIEAGLANLSPPLDDELEMLDQTAPNPARFRLACQAVVLGDVVCRVPS